MFEQLSKFVITADTTKTFALHGIVLGADPDQTPTLTVRHGGDTNPGFSNEVAKRADELNAGAGRTSAARELARGEVWAAIIAEHCITGWGHVYDGGKPVEFTADACKQLLLALLHLTPDLFWQLLVFVRAIGNFRPTPSAALGKA